jgi:hypothetical protein
MSEFFNCHFLLYVVPCGLRVVVVVVEKWNSYVIFIFSYSFSRKFAQKSKNIKNGKEKVI